MDRGEVGIQGPGMDCSNFASWAYNFALGIKLDGSVTKAAEITTIAGPGGVGTLTVHVIPNTGQTYDELVQTLQPDDVLYFHSDKDASTISHSALWIGSMAIDENDIDQYFVLDSTGAGTLDSNNVPIPDGVHLRPFNGEPDQPGHWYFRQFDHAHRIIPLINAAPAVRVSGSNRRHTKHRRIHLAGTATSAAGISRVQYRVETSGTTSWSLDAALSNARNTTIQMRAIGGNGITSPIVSVRVKQRIR